MSIAVILLQQLIIMVLLMAAGYLMFKGKKISLEGSRSLANILVYLCLPCVIIKGFLVEQTTQATIGLLISAVAAAVTLGAAMWISRIFFKKDAVANFASVFSNAGFFGVPLITACISDGATFYVAAFIAFLNLLQWTYGVDLLTGGRGKLSLKKVITAPFMIAILIGLFFYFSGIAMPHILLQCVNFLAGCNTPIAMFTIGIYLAGRMVRNPKNRKMVGVAAMTGVVVQQFLGMVVDILKVQFAVSDFEAVAGLPESVFATEGFAFLNDVLFSGILFCLLPTLFLVPKLYGRIEPLLGMQPRTEKTYLGNIGVKVILGSLIAFGAAVAAEFMAESGLSGIDWEASWAGSSTNLAVALVVAAAAVLAVVLVFRMKGASKVEKGEV